MKVPDIFTPEKNLENETERLLKEEPKIKTDEFKPAVEKSELERVLELFDTEYSRAFSDEHLWENIDRLIGKSDYRPIQIKRRRTKYWNRPSPYNTKESFVFIKNFNKNGNPCYSFAIVGNEKLEEFCKRFEKERAITNGQILYSHLSKGAVIGGALGLIADYAIARAIGSSNSFTSAGICSLGVMFGFFYGAFIIKYAQNKNKEKLNKCYKCLMTSSNTASKDVLKAAFS